MIGSAILSEQKGDDKDFPFPRKDYRNALLNGDAAIMKQLNVQGELKYTGAIDSSCSDTECSHTNTQCCQNPIETTTLPLFPMIKLKRRRVMYYIPIKFDDVDVDALVDTRACLSAIPLNLYNKILGLAGAMPRTPGVKHPGCKLRNMPCAFLRDNVVLHKWLHRKLPLPGRIFGPEGNEHPPTRITFLQI